MLTLGRAAVRCNACIHLMASMVTGRRLSPIVKGSRPKPVPT
jgi:hypothetical protein